MEEKSIDFLMKMNEIYNKNRDRFNYLEKVAFEMANNKRAKFEIKGELMYMNGEAIR